MACLFLDECVHQALAEHLRAFGHDVVTCAQTGHASRGYPDDRHLQDRRRDGRILVSYNRKHFYRLHEANPEHPGIIVCHQTADIAALAAEIHGHLERNPDLHGQLIRIRGEGPACG